MSSQESRLTQLQMRYQQKVMQETAQKKSDMYGGYDDTQKLLTTSLGAGKVRAMFDEHRRAGRGAGIDKSYLLAPITVETNKTTTISSKRQVIGPAKTTTREQKMSNYSKVIVPPLQNRTSNNHDINGNNHYRNEPPTAIDRSFRPVDTPVVNFKPRGVAAQKTVNNASTMRRPTPAVPSTTSPPLKNVTNQKASPSRSMKSGNSTSSTNSMRSTTNGSPQQKVTAPTTNNNSVRSVPKITSPVSAKSENSPSGSFDEVDEGPVPEGLAKCSICRRNFAEDRLEKHQSICQKTKTKKRKIYDASKKRVQGTEAESYLKKPITSARGYKAKANVVAAPTTGAPPQKNANWRSKHEDFIKTIRAAKEMQAYVAKGGKLSDLPPPPPSENLDYVQCPHCSRRFNEGAASRHIPVCTSINKPKPKAALNSKTNSFASKRR